MTKAQAPKDPRPEESKVRGPELTVMTALPRFNNPESYAKAWREKKKDRRQNKQRDRQGQEGSTSVTGVYVAKPGKPKQKKKNRDQNYLNKTPRDVSQVMCYNCNRKGYYLNACPETLKN